MTPGASEPGKVPEGEAVGRPRAPYGQREHRDGRAALAGLLIGTYLDMGHPDRELLERARQALDEALGDRG